MLHEKDIREKLKDIDEFLLDEYVKNHPEKKRDWRTYEEQYSHRIKTAMAQLEPLVSEAVGCIHIPKKPGNQYDLTLKQRVLLLLMQRLFKQSNRMMAAMLSAFSILSGIDVDYKKIERLYSDPEVELALFNLHTLILKKKGVQKVDACGDGTGYSVTISRHYASTAQKEKDDAKENGVASDQKETDTKKASPKKRGRPLFTVSTVDEIKLEFKKRRMKFDADELARISINEADIVLFSRRGKRYRIVYSQGIFEVSTVKKGFVYSFKLTDLATKMYIASGISLKSEKEAFERAMKMLERIDVTLNSVRLDRYYSCPFYVDMFGNTKVFVIPKKNATLKGSWKWKRTMKEFVTDTPAYLEQYFQRQQSEAGWSMDKRRFGWQIAQRRLDRIATADVSTAVWHNLLQLGAE